LTLEMVRDLAVIFMAVVMIVVGIGVVVLIWQVVNLIGFAKNQGQDLMKIANEILDRVNEILDRLKEAAQTTAQTAKKVEGAAEFVGDKVARPVIELYAAVAGASRFAEAVFRRRHREQRGGET